jgi:hypothetical protein
VANHSPRNKTRLPKINKPQARISGVEISMCYPIDSNTCIDFTTCMDRLLGFLRPEKPLKVLANLKIL